MKQEQIWDTLAEWWNNYRNQPIPEVVEFLKNKKGKVLDLGCGSGRNIVSNKNIKYYGADFSGEMLKHAEKNSCKSGASALFFKAEADDLPFDDDFFDAVVCISTIHLIKEPEQRKKALEEIYRVMKKNAEAIISVWDKSTEPKIKDINAKESIIGWKHDGKNYGRYYYFYEKKELEEILKKIGFKIMNRKTKGSFHAKKNFVFYIKK